MQRGFLGGLYFKELMCRGAYFWDFMLHRTFMRVCAPCMAHPVGWGNASLCHRGHTEALIPAAQPH